MYCYEAGNCLNWANPYLIYRWTLSKMLKKPVYTSEVACNVPVSKGYCYNTKDFILQYTAFKVVYVKLSPNIVNISLLGLLLTLKHLFS